MSSQHWKRALTVKQQDLFYSFLEKNHRYRINIHTGEIKSYRRLTSSWEVLQPRMTHSGAVFYCIHKGRGLKEQIYGHHIIWLMAYGISDENISVYHKDGDKTNNALHNLSLRGTLLQENPVRKSSRKIEHKHFVEIVELLRNNPKITIKEICEIVKCGYNPVSYTVKRIKKGEVLRSSPHYKNKKSSIEKWKDNINNADYWLTADPLAFKFL